MKPNIFVNLLVLSSTVLLFAWAASAQEGVQTRSITSDDFGKQRPADAESSGKTGKKTNRYTYRLARKDKNVVRHKRRRKAPTRKPTADVMEVGVTVWKMRAPHAAEKDMFMLPVLDDNSERQMWLAERVGLNTIFKAGDRVRFAVETSKAGYLYVIGRETSSDGSFGAPYPVFPASPTDNNLVSPGMLFDFPDQKEDLPYLKMNPQRPNYSGELLTVIISPKQLTNLGVDANGKLKNIDDLAELEFNSDVEVFTRNDLADRIYSRSESESACGVKTRELVREGAADKPCGNTTRPLTVAEPFPQSIYRIKTAPGQPAVAFVKLPVRK